MAQIVILGAGFMGTAFSTPLADNGHQVNLVGTHLDNAIIEEIHDSRTHPRLHVRVPDQVQPYTYDRLAEAMQGAELIVLGVNSLGIDWATQMLGTVLPPDLPLLFLTKGLAAHEQSLQILPHALRDGLPPHLRNSVRLAAIGGPSIAGELAVRRHTCVAVSGMDKSLLEKLAGLLLPVRLGDRSLCVGVGRRKLFEQFLLFGGVAVGARFGSQNQKLLAVGGFV